MSFSKGSAITIGVKAHVLFSRLLKPDEYWMMLGFKSTSEIAAFLKQTEGYRDHMVTLIPEKVHRIDLEDTIHASILREANSFLYYLSGDMRNVFTDWLALFEAQDLKSILRWLRSKRIDRDTMRKHLYCPPSSALPYDALLNCRDYQEVYECLRTAKVSKMLFEPLRRLISGESTLFPLEMAIDFSAESRFYEDFKKLPHEERKVLMPIVGARVDLMNLYNLHRCMWYYNMTLEETLSRMMPMRYKVTTHHLRELAKETNGQESLEKLEELFPVYGKIFSDALDQDEKELALEVSIARYEYTKSLAVLQNGFPGFHTAFAYFMIKNFEISDLVRIIEEVRYGYDSRYAAQYLIKPILTGGEHAWQ